MVGITLICLISAFRSHEKQGLTLVTVTFRKTLYDSAQGSYLAQIANL